MSSPDLRTPPVVQGTAPGSGTHKIRPGQRNLAVTSSHGAVAAAAAAKALALLVQSAFSSSAYSPSCFV